jgi:hypothetical protein
MRIAWMPVAAGIMAGVLAGCGGGGEGGSDTPMATSGPNEVVIKVPGMT